MTGKQELYESYLQNISNFMHWGFSNIYTEYQCTLEFERAMENYISKFPHSVFSCVIIDLDEYSENRDPFLIQAMNGLIRVSYNHYKCDYRNEKKLLSDEEAYLRTWALLVNSTESLEKAFESVFHQSIKQYVENKKKNMEGF